MNKILREKLELLWAMNQCIDDLRAMQAQFNAMTKPEYQYAQEFPRMLDLVVKLDKSDFELIEMIIEKAYADMDREVERPEPTPQLALEVS